MRGQELPFIEINKKRQFETVVVLVSETIGLSEKVVLVVAPVVDLAFHELLGSQDGGVGHFLVGAGDLDLFFVLVDLFQAVGMARELFELIVQFFPQGNIDLVGSPGNDGNRLIEVTGFAFDIDQAVDDIFSC